MDDAHLLPIACPVLLLIFAILSVETLESTSAVIAVASIGLPIVMYVWGCLYFGMMNATDISGQGYLTLFFCHLMAHANLQLALAPGHLVGRGWSTTCSPGSK